MPAKGCIPARKAFAFVSPGKERVVIDGPFTETKELVAGYWIWQVKSMEEAIAWVKRCPNPMTEDSDIEIRPIFSPEDFGEAFTPELRQQEERLAVTKSRPKRRIPRWIITWAAELRPHGH